MPCCCVLTINLCDVPICEVLELNVLATGPGSAEENNYKLVLDFLQAQVTLTQEQTEGENVKFNIGFLNENFEYTGKVFDSQGNAVTIAVGELEYDCIKFKTVMNISL